MSKQSYASYAQRYKFFLNKLQDTNALTIKRNQYLKDKAARMEELLNLTNDYTEIRKKKNHILNLQEHVSDRNKILNQRKIEYEKYSKLCDDKLSTIQHYKKILEAFIQQRREDSRASERKK